MEELRTEQSVEMENPKTVMEKIDAAHNLVEQIRIANIIRDFSHVEECVERASNLLFEATQMLEEQCMETQSLRN